MLFAGAHVAAFDRTQMFVFANALTLWIYLPAYFIAVAAVSFRHYLLALAAGIVVVAQLCWIVPPMMQRVAIPDAARRGPHLRIVSANLNYSNDHHPAVVAELARDDADVIVLEEVTPAWWSAIEASTLVSTHPHYVHRERSEGGGLAVLSRTPLTDVVEHQAGRWPQFTATLSVDGRAVHLVAVHAITPLLFSRSQQSQREITAVVRGLPKPRIVVGDFNATPYSRWFHQLLDLGLREAHDAVGRPLATTWPNGTHHHILPLRLDHLFADASIVPLSAAEGTGAGSDHRPIIVDLAILGP